MRRGPAQTRAAGLKIYSASLLTVYSTGTLPEQSEEAEATRYII
jgi:hypothetical protein